MYYTFNIEEQVHSIMKKIKASDFDKPTKTTNDLCDITDGELYQRVLASIDGPLFKKMRAFSFSMNTDGASLLKAQNCQCGRYFLLTMSCLYIDSLQ